MTHTIVAIHGLWMNGMEMSLLRRRLSALRGGTCRQFSYRSVGRGLDHNMAGLRNFIDRQQGAPVDIVAHSLGGVLALKTLQAHPELNVGRVVCLGSPLVDSAAARTLMSRPWSRKAVGRTLGDALTENLLTNWSGDLEVGSIAGTLPFGMGRLLMRLPQPHDGAVASIETQLPGVTAHVEMRVSHFGLVLSPAVAAQVAHFFRVGKFSA
jgi:pimeloyl-ACP methyl ester carboxylesterase